MNEFEIAFRYNADQDSILRALIKDTAKKTGSDSEFFKGVVASGKRYIDSLKAEAEEKIRHNNETLSVKLANEANQKIKNELKPKIDSIKETLNIRLHEFITPKKNMIDSIAIKPIPPEMWAQLETFRTRMDNGEMSEYELSLFNKYFATNNQAVNIFADICKKHDITILPALNPVRSHDNLNAFAEMAQATINVLDSTNESLIAMSFLSDNPNAPIAKLINDIDTDFASMIPAPRRTALERLRKASRNASENDDFMTAGRINTFIENHINELATPEEMSDVFDKAEVLIEKGMSAKKS